MSHQHSNPDCTLHVQSKMHATATNPWISTWEAYFKFTRIWGCLFEGGALSRGVGGTYLFFPKSWPGIVIYFLNDLHFTKKQYLSTRKADPKV